MTKQHSATIYGERKRGISTSCVSRIKKSSAPWLRRSGNLRLPIVIIEIVAAAMGIPDKKIIVYDYFSLNHFGWFTSIEYKGSWYYVWKGVYEIMENSPEMLLNYYLQQKEFVEHSVPGHTRVNDVMESRRKNLFDGIDHYLAVGEIDGNVFYEGGYGD